MKIGGVDVSQIQFDRRSRDDVPQVLRGLQPIYVNLRIRIKKVFEILEEHILPKVNKKND